MIRLHLLMGLVKSKQRVGYHGEVFTPVWLVEAMFDLVKGETERIDSRFLEQACGDGNFLVQILRRKLAAVELEYGQSEFKRRHYALLALMCLYGIELLSPAGSPCSISPPPAIRRGIQVGKRNRHGEKPYCDHIPSRAR